MFTSLLIIAAVGMDNGGWGNAASAPVAAKKPGRSVNIGWDGEAFAARPLPTRFRKEVDHVEVAHDGAPLAAANGRAVAVPAAGQRPDCAQGPGHDVRDVAGPSAGPAGGVHAGRPVVPAAKKPIGMPRPPEKPVVHYLADASGHRWYHTDLKWLRQWVAQKNAELKAKADDQPRQYRAVDSAGKIWFHQDRAVLRQFIADRNRQLRSPVLPPSAYYQTQAGSYYCAPGLSGGS